jgi:nitrate/TMAO reductase-like tetraheme cytochrome c subunit
MAQRLRYLVFLIACLGAGLLSAEPGGYATGGSKLCIGCHDYSDQSPVHPLLATSHGDAQQKGTPMAERGCESCHGPSAAHASAPTINSPGVSFGPRWNSGMEEQNSQCLECHQDSVSKSWQTSVHAKQNIGCATCHDSHAEVDKTLQASTQIEACVLCHKPQKTGIHALSEKVGDNPGCSSCHNPHGNPSAIHQMLSNRSAGCNSCHNLVAMAKDPKVSAKATSYHKTMSQRGRTCIDCHSGIAHAPASGVAPILPARAVSRKTITLFAPGQADREWLMSEHPGSQPLRQGLDCETCHRGEEAKMGAQVAAEGAIAARDVDISFKRQQERLLISLSWRGAAADQQVSIMWGDSGSREFSRGACWAACHRDMPGMKRDRGQGLEKYLAASRDRQYQIGRPVQTLPQAELDKLMAEGNYVELWQLSLEQGASARSASILARINWSEKSTLQGSASFRNGRWTATFSRPLAGIDGQKGFTRQGRYTFGVALQGAGQTAAAHWVSLPLTFSLTSKDTDFAVVP